MGKNDTLLNRYIHISDVLKTERECILRQNTDACQRNVGKTCEGCDLCLPEEVILRVYNLLIEGYDALIEDHKKQNSYEIIAHIRRTFGGDEKDE